MAKQAKLDIMQFVPTDDWVASKSLYKTREEFRDALKKDYDVSVDTESIDDGYVRYYPRGTEDSEGEFGKGVGVYQFVDKPGRGVMAVWTA